MEVWPRHEVIFDLSVTYMFCQQDQTKARKAKRMSVAYIQISVDSCTSHLGFGLDYASPSDEESV